MTKETIEYLPVADIDTAPQVRENAVDDSIRNLAVTLRDAGLQQPIRVRRNGDRFIVVDGERRLRAARLLKWELIAAMVEQRELSDTEVVQRQLIANCMRKDLSRMEIARAIDALIKESNRSDAEVGSMIGFSGPTVSRYRAMLELPPTMQEHVQTGALPYSKACELKNIKDPEKQAELVERAVNGKMSRDAIKAEVKKSKRKSKSTKRSHRRSTIVLLSNGRSVSATGLESGYDALIVALLEAVDLVKAAQAKGIALDDFLKASKGKSAA